MNLLITLAEETIEKLLPHVSLVATLNTLKNAAYNILKETDETLSTLFSEASAEELTNIRKTLASSFNTINAQGKNKDSAAPVSEAVEAVEASAAS